MNNYKFITQVDILIHPYNFLEVTFLFPNYNTYNKHYLDLDILPVCKAPYNKDIILVDISLFIGYLL